MLMIYLFLALSDFADFELSESAENSLMKLVPAEELVLQFATKRPLIMMTFSV